MKREEMEHVVTICIREKLTEKMALRYFKAIVADILRAAKEIVVGLGEHDCQDCKA